jgi:hypothetical protein
MSWSPDGRLLPNPSCLIHFDINTEPDALRLVPQAVGGARRADAGKGLSPPRPQHPQSSPS